MNIRYPAVIKPQKPGGYFVRFPDIEEAVTQGETIDECLFNAAEVLSLVLDHRIAKGQPIPKPSRIKGARMVSPDAKTQAAILIRIMRGKRPVSDVARALGTSWPSAQRLEDPKHWPSLRQLEKAASALGKRLVLSLE
ncbi:MAG: type II toxin-antitoxin system HicB family antitoxin [Acidobacteria bacterium]|nr:type II toxin-antitoxin system HicB family antitoxin [Acidobacteriota bacterium]